MEQIIRHLGYKLNILIIADTCIGYATSLYEFFSKYADVNCMIVNSDKEYIMRLADFEAPDFLLIAGYLRNSDNYEIIDSVRDVNLQAYTLFLGEDESNMKACCSTYQINDYFDSNLPFELLADHIRLLQYKRLNGFDFSENHLFADLLWNNKKYHIAEYSNEPMIYLRNLGIYPAGPSSMNKPVVCYDELYRLDKDRLILDCLHIPTVNGIFPEINGRKPAYSYMHLYYNKLMLEVPYTGKITIGLIQQKPTRFKNDFINIFFNYQEMFELSFEDGKMFSYKQTVYSSV